MRIDGKVALITGGGTGIGAAIAERFVNEGAKVVITGRRQQMLDEVASTLPKSSVATCAGDVTKFEDAERMVKTALDLGGKLDVLVNNAGIDPPGSIVDIDIKLWRQIIDINLTGPFLLMKATLPHMIKAGGGSIINIASLAGLRCISSMPAYCSSKAGLIMLTQQAAHDYGPSKIRCNVVCPGATRTPMLEQAQASLMSALNTDLDGAFKYFSANAPLRRVANPVEMTGICLFLASNDSAYMTGAVLVMDGGAAIVDVNDVQVKNAGVKWGG
jgi:meso-butanediol dehydrogenase / (S,S)-butanediol dehydrogenase / diacetyl reductase